jgi:hypothetical protein
MDAVAHLLFLFVTKHHFRSFASADLLRHVLGKMAQFILPHQFLLPGYLGQQMNGILESVLGSGLSGLAKQKVNFESVA